MSRIVVEAYQHLRGLTPDGVAGRLTREDAQSVIAEHSRLIVPEAVPLYEGVATGSAYERMVWSWMHYFKDVNAREIGGNNSGPWVAFFHMIPDDGDPDDDGSWCASFQATCYELSAEQLGMSVPATYSKRQRAGAKALFGRMAKGGERVDPDNLVHGQLYVVCWDRGQYAWQGHIEYGYYDAETDDFVTIGANVGSFKRVAGRVRMFRHESWRHKLHGVARLGA